MIFFVFLNKRKFTNMQVRPIRIVLIHPHPRYLVGYFSIAPLCVEVPGV